MNKLITNQQQQNISNTRQEKQQEVVCLKFSHLKFCGCVPECSMRNSVMTQIVDKIYVGNLSSALFVDNLKQKGISNILKVICDQYTQQKDFNYLSIEVFDEDDEDIKKNFRISNRYISSKIEKGEKVLIHDENGDSVGLVFCLAFMINNLQIPLKKGLQMIQRHNIDPKINDYFMNQLEQYDIEKISNYKESTVQN